MKRTDLEKTQMSHFVMGIIKGVQYCRKDSAEILKDHWLTWNEQTDINIWSDDQGYYHACAYDVIDGKTITETWTDIETW